MERAATDRRDVTKYDAQEFKTLKCLLFHHALYTLTQFKREINWFDSLVGMIALSPHSLYHSQSISSDTLCHATQWLYWPKVNVKGYLCKPPKFTQSKLNVVQYIAINKNKTTTNFKWIDIVSLSLCVHLQWRAFGYKRCKWSCVSAWH